MVAIKNINVGLFENKSEGWKEVRFNLDKGCPKGFHRWFPEEKKLFGRYVNFYQSGDNPGVNICKSVGYTNSNVIKSGSNLINQNNSNLLFMTYWEYLVLQYIMCAYYKSFNRKRIWKQHYPKQDYFRLFTTYDIRCKSYSMRICRNNYAACLYNYDNSSRIYSIPKI